LLYRLIVDLLASKEPAWETLMLVGSVELVEKMKSGSKSGPNARGVACKAEALEELIEYHVAELQW
jgi:hypothetical protein